MRTSRALLLARMLLGRQQSRSFFEAVQLAGDACVAKKRRRSIYHGTCAALFHSSFGVVVEWAMEMCWKGVVVDGCMQVNIPHVLSSFHVHMYSSLYCVSASIFAHVS